MLLRDYNDMDSYYGEYEPDYTQPAYTPQLSYADQLSQLINGSNVRNYWTGGTGDTSGATFNRMGVNSPVAVFNQNGREMNFMPWEIASKWFGNSQGSTGMLDFLGNKSLYGQNLAMLTPEQMQGMGAYTDFVKTNYSGLQNPNLGYWMDNDQFWKLVDQGGNTTGFDSFNPFNFQVGEGDAVFRDEDLAGKFVNSLSQDQFNSLMKQDGFRDAYLKNMGTDQWNDKLMLTAGPSDDGGRDTGYSMFVADPSSAKGFAYAHNQSSLFGDLDPYIGAIFSAINPVAGAVYNGTRAGLEGDLGGALAAAVGGYVGYSNPLELASGANAALSGGLSGAKDGLQGMALGALGGYAGDALSSMGETAALNTNQVSALDGGYFDGLMAENAFDTGAMADAVGYSSGAPYAALTEVPKFSFENPYQNVIDQAINGQAYTSPMASGAISQAGVSAGMAPITESALAELAAQTGLNTGGLLAASSTIPAIVGDGIKTGINGFTDALNADAAAQSVYNPSILDKIIDKVSNPSPPSLSDVKNIGNLANLATGGLQSKPERKPTKINMGLFNKYANAPQLPQAALKSQAFKTVGLPEEALRQRLAKIKGGM